MQINLEKVEKLYFCVLSNDSIDKVKDYVGEDRIGNIDFVKKDNLITTDDIIQRAKTDIKFQKALFDFLQNENDSLMQIGDKLDGSIAISKTLIKNNIDDLPNIKSPYIFQIFRFRYFFSSSIQN